MDLKDKILPGYAYTIDTGGKGPRLHTGRGGVLLFIDACRKQGLPDSFIEESIYCTLEEGTYPLTVLKHKPKS